MENWQVPSCLTRWAAEPNSPREGHKFTCSPSCDKFGGASWRVNVYRRTHVGLLLMLRQVKSEPGSTSGIWLTPKFNQFKRVTPYPQPWPIAYRVWSTSRNVFVSYIARRGTHRHTDIHHNTIPAPSTDVPIKVQENIVTFRTVKCSLDAAKRGFYRAFNSIFGKIGHILHRKKWFSSWCPQNVYRSYYTALRWSLLFNVQIYFILSMKFFDRWCKSSLGRWK